MILYGAHADDSAGFAYPDCSPVFNDAMNQAIFEGSGHQLKVEAPFVNMTKAEVVKMGLELNAPYELTWSCYEGKMSLAANVNLYRQSGCICSKWGK